MSREIHVRFCESRGVRFPPATHLVVLVRGEHGHVQALREEIAGVLEPIGLRLSEAKTQVVHMSEGFDFLGFHIRWRRKRGTSKWYVYTFVATRPIRSVRDKVRALTRRTSQQDLRTVLIRINQITRGWTNYFRHAVAKHTFSHLRQFTWWRIVRMMRMRHRWTWTDVRRWLRDPNGHWRPITADGITMFDAATVTVTRYRWRGYQIPNPWVPAA
jgi:RNA-directed DNA polymerase